MTARFSAEPRGWPVLICVILALAMSACQRNEEPAKAPPARAGEVVLDLIDELPAATVHKERAALELGDIETQQHLTDGWSNIEEDVAGAYVWSLSPRSSFNFFAAAPAAVSLRLHCQPLIFDNAPEQTMRVSVGGELLAETTMEREPGHYRVEIPREHVTGGLNRVDIDFGYYRRPRDVIEGAADDRELGVRCFDIELKGLGATASPRVAGPETRDRRDDDSPEAATPSLEDLDRLELPTGTSVTYYFEQPSSVELIARAVETWGPQADSVGLIVRSASSERTQTTSHPVDLAAEESTLRLALEAAGPSIGRVELAAVDVERAQRGWFRRLFDSGPKANGLTLIQPAIYTQDEDPARELSTESLSPATPAAVKPNVLIYLIDTLRADHLGTYGYPRPTSPNIDRFAANALLFEDARAQSSWTRPTVVSILTGLAPRRHGVNRREDALSDSVDTLAELLAADGYATAGYVTNGNAGPNFGLDQGFEEFRHLAESADTHERHQLSDYLNRWLFHWLENRLENRGDDDRPFFLYAHSTDPHLPYTPPEPFRSRFAPNVAPETGRLDQTRAIFRGEVPSTERIRRDLIDLYDGEIAFNDHHFGRLIERLKELDLYENTLIVLLSDHGEEFLDHGDWEHGITLFDEQLHVPLILKLPHQTEGQRIARTVNQIDVVPTILDLLGIPPPALDGKSLLNAAERSSFAYLTLSNHQLRSITHNGWKLILDDSLSPQDGPLRLFSLIQDESELDELSEARPFERELLAQVMRRWEHELAQGAQAIGEQAEIPEELRRQLEALGYL